LYIVLDRQIDVNVAPLLHALQYNFEGRLDLVKFLKMIQEHDMYAIVRIGPFIQAEWNHGSVRPTNYHSSVKYAHIDLIVLCFFYAISLLSSSGLPYWLREIDHIIFRANNDPYKVIKEFPIHGCNKDMHVQFWTNGIWTFHAERNGEMDEIHSAEVEGC